MGRSACDVAWGLTSRGVAIMICLAVGLTARADTLSGALANAYRNNPQLNSQRAVVRATDESVPQALSGYKPTVSATAQIERVYTSSGGTRSVSLPSSVGLAATQTLFNGFQTANRIRQAESNTSAAREALRVAEQTVLLNAATAYMDLIRDSALLELQRRNVEVLQEQLRQTRDRFNVGEVTRTDVAQAESRLAQGRASVLTAEAHYARSRANYRQFVGVEAGALQPA